jgi:hypothetical protein
MRVYKNRVRVRAGAGQKTPAHVRVGAGVHFCIIKTFQLLSFVSE